MHQLMGHADLLFGDACEMLRAAGAAHDADRIERELVGRNVLHGRWTFQMVDEFDEGYYDVARAVVRRLEADHCQGERHAFERRMKGTPSDQRRAGSRAGTLIAGGGPNHRRVSREVCSGTKDP